MKPVSLLALMAIICTVYSCSSAKGKKVVVMSSGKMQVDSKDYKTILFEPGTQPHRHAVPHPENVFHHEMGLAEGGQQLLGSGLEFTWPLG